MTELLHERYRAIGSVGRGGMGVVYKAQDTRFQNRLVAVKKMRQDNLQPSGIPAAARRFEQEACILADLNHANLPRIWDHFQEAGNYYLVMDFIEGETLDGYQRAQGGRLPLQEVLEIGIELCTVLHYLHTQQPRPIVFRDLKPPNIMRTPDGHIYLIDFGIARLFKPDQTHDTTLGWSAGYAPPEQLPLYHEQTTPRSDIYSLGATLHHLLTGKHPSQNKPSVFDFASLQSFDLSLPSTLNTLIMQMVAKDAGNRPPSMAVVKEELQGIAAEELQHIAAQAPGRQTIVLPPPNHNPSPAPSLITEVQEVASAPPNHPAEPIGALYGRALVARGRGDLEQAILLLEQVLTIDPNHLSGRAASLLRDIRLQLLRRQAREAKWAQAYQEEERLWKEVLSLNSQDREANRCLREVLKQQAKQARLQGQWTLEIKILRELKGRALPKEIKWVDEAITVATKNKEYAEKYESIKQMVEEGQTRQDSNYFRAARKELHALWHEHRDYPDHAHLAKTIGARQFIDIDDIMLLLMYLSIAATVALVAGIRVGGGVAGAVIGMGAGIAVGAGARTRAVVLVAAGLVIGMGAGIAIGVIAVAGATVAAVVAGVGVAGAAIAIAAVAEAVAVAVGALVVALAGAIGIFVVVIVALVGSETSGAAAEIVVVGIIVGAIVVKLFFTLLDNRFYR